VQLSVELVREPASELAVRHWHYSWWIVDTRLESSGSHGDVGDVGAGSIRRSYTWVDLHSTINELLKHFSELFVVVQQCLQLAALNGVFGSIYVDLKLLMHLSDLTILLLELSTLNLVEEVSDLVIGGNSL
jgi:hypothetical protein